MLGYHFDFFSDLETNIIFRIDWIYNMIPVIYLSNMIPVFYIRRSLVPILHT